jgi:hypothetical protein
MPVLHEYRDKRGMYLKARHGKRMVTYQLAPAGVARLHSRGMGDGSKISPDVLNGLVSEGLAYTHGSGAGVIDVPAAPPAKGTSTASDARNHRHHRNAEPVLARKPERPVDGWFSEPRPAPPPVSRPTTPPVLIPPPPPAASGSPAHRESRLFPGSCYTDRPTSPSTSTSTPERRPPPSRPEPLMVQPAPAVHPAPPLRPESPVEAAGERFDLWRVGVRMWEAITSEALGIPMWLWLVIVIGLLVPVLLIGSLVCR